MYNLIQITDRGGEIKLIVVIFMPNIMFLVLFLYDAHLSILNVFTRLNVNTNTFVIKQKKKDMFKYQKSCCILKLFFLFGFVLSKLF